MTRMQWASNKAKQLLNEYKNKGLIDNDWKFGWNRRKSALGLCSFRKKEISLSVYYVEVGTEAQIFDTISHEISHILAGEDAGHGPRWKYFCRMTGANPVRCGKTVDMPCRYKGTCPICKFEYRAQRQLKGMDRRVCTRKGCTAKYLKLYVKWEKG